MIWPCLVLLVLDLLHSTHLLVLLCSLYYYSTIVAFCLVSLFSDPSRIFRPLPKYTVFPTLLHFYTDDLLDRNKIFFFNTHEMTLRGFVWKIFYNWLLKMEEKSRENSVFCEGLLGRHAECGVVADSLLQLYCSSNAAGG